MCPIVWPSSVDAVHVHRCRARQRNAEGRAGRAPARYSRTASRSALPALNDGALEAAMAMGSPVPGLRP